MKTMIHGWCVREAAGQGEDSGTQRPARDEQRVPGKRQKGEVREMGKLQKEGVMPSQAEPGGPGGLTRGSFGLGHEESGPVLKREPWSNPLPFVDLSFLICKT